MPLILPRSFFFFLYFFIFFPGDWSLSSFLVGLGELLALNRGVLFFFDGDTLVDGPTDGPRDRLAPGELLRLLLMTDFLSTSAIDLPSTLLCPGVIPFGSCSFVSISIFFFLCLCLCLCFGGCTITRKRSQSVHI